MSERFISEEDFSPNVEGEDFRISDGMEPVQVPEKMTAAEFLALCGGSLPEGISPDILKDGTTLELEQ